MKKFCVYVVCLLLASCSSNNNLNHSNENIVFLDYAAAYGVSADSLKEFIRVCLMQGNSSGINPHAKQLKQIELYSKRVIANKIEARPDQIHFTSGATEANNIAILGVAYKNPGCHFITSKIEHKSVLNVFKYLEDNGWQVTYLDVDRFGNIKLQNLLSAIRSNTRLISIQMLNSEIGTLQNINKIGEIAHENEILFHTDASQAFCKYDIDVNKMNLDLVTISGYKVGSPKGIGALYVRDVEKLSPILFGSGDVFCPGTKPTALIAAFARAVETFKFNKSRVIENYNVLVTELEKINDIRINSFQPSHIVSVSIGGVLLDDILNRMKNYSFSAGCSCLGKDMSNVIAAIDPNDELPASTLRISFSDNISAMQLINFARTLKKVVEQLRREKIVEKGCFIDISQYQKQLQKNLEEVQDFLKK